MLSRMSCWRLVISRSATKAVVVVTWVAAKILYSLYPSHLVSVFVIAYMWYAFLLNVNSVFSFLLIKEI